MRTLGSRSIPSEIGPLPCLTGIAPDSLLIPRWQALSRLCRVDFVTRSRCQSHRKTRITASCERLQAFRLIMLAPRGGMLCETVQAGRTLRLGEALMRL